MTELLATKRLILRPWKIEDARALFFYASDKDVGPSAGWPAHKSIEESKEVIKNVLSNRDTFAICLNYDLDNPIGSIVLKHNDASDFAKNNDECELGFWIAKPFWGNGYVGEASKIIIDYAFKTLNMNKVFCGYYEENIKSKKAQNKLGFKFFSRQENVYVMLLDCCKTVILNVIEKKDWLYKQENEIIIETDRLYLRKIKKSDFDSWQKVLGDGENMKFYSYDFDVDRINRWINHNLLRYDVYGFGWWAVIEKSTGEMIGDCGVSIQNINNFYAPEIGYHLRADKHRQGIITEAASACRDWIFNNTPFNMVFSYMKKENIASSGVAKKIGMKFIEEYELCGEGMLSVYAINRKDWEINYK